MDTNTKTEGILPKVTQPRRLKRKLASGKVETVGKPPWWHWILTGIMMILATVGTAFILLISPLPIVYASILGVVFVYFLSTATTYHPWVFSYYFFLFFLIGALHTAIHYGLVRA